MALTNPVQLIVLDAKSYSASVGTWQTKVGGIQPPGSGVPFTSIYASNMSGGVAEGMNLAPNTVLVVHDQATFNKVFQVPTTQLVAPIDFSKKTVLVVWAGMRPTSGYSVAVTDIRWLPNGPVGGPPQGTVQETAPAPGTITLQVITSPVQIVEVDTKIMNQNVLVNWTKP